VGRGGQVSSDNLPTLKLICTGNDPQHLTSTPGERRGCAGESDHVTLPHLQKRNSPLSSALQSSFNSSSFHTHGKDMPTQKDILAIISHFTLF